MFVNTSETNDRRRSPLMKPFVHILSHINSLPVVLFVQGIILLLPQSIHWWKTSIRQNERVIREKPVFVVRKRFVMANIKDCHSILGSPQLWTEFSVFQNVSWPTGQLCFSWQMCFLPKRHNCGDLVEISVICTYFSVFHISSVAW